MQQAVTLAATTITNVVYVINRCVPLIIIIKQCIASIAARQLKRPKCRQPGAKIHKQGQLASSSCSRWPHRHRCLLPLAFRCHGRGSNDCRIQVRVALGADSVAGVYCSHLYTSSMQRLGRLELPDALGVLPSVLVSLCQESETHFVFLSMQRLGRLQLPGALGAHGAVGDARARALCLHHLGRGHRLDFSK